MDLNVKKCVVVSLSRCIQTIQFLYRLNDDAVERVKTVKRHWSDILGQCESITPFVG